jgi:hypothetical protein
MPELLIRIKKKTDGGAALSCIRRDGSTTWQRQDGRLGAFFPLHDLTHYAVETALGLRRAFYGLVAEGWDISAFDERGIAARLPEEALLAEVVVSFFDAERASGTISSADDFNWKLDTYFAEHDAPSPPFRMTDDALAKIREVRGGLFSRWRDLPAGDTLELSFDRAPIAVAP